ncbi:PREDICTED: uncharacterized protein LOC108794040 [Nanorana parkeri]|nr:PREDICTED: uncharacterized protein LOC108794040 [Nanorana parkeri]
MRMKFFPKVLKSLPRSESRYSENNECIPPSCIVPEEIVSQKLEVEESQENEDEYKEGNYTSRKKLLDSDTSGGDSSGPVLSSLESSGQMTGSSGEEKISIELPIGLGIIKDSADSFLPIPANDLELSSDLPFDNSRSFNINLNSICRGDPIDARKGLKNGGSLKEDPEGEPDMDSGLADLSINGDISVCASSILVDMEPTAIEYGSDDYEEDFSDHDNCDSGDHVVSGYMRR